MHFSLTQLLVVLVIVVLLFGTKRLAGIGSDLGTAIKGFKRSMTDEADKEHVAQDEQPTIQSTAQVVKKEEQSVGHV